MHIKPISTLIGRVKTSFLRVKTQVGMPKRFDGLLKEASTLNNSVSFYGNTIHNFNELSKMIASRGSNINEDTLHIFEKAIITNNASASADYLSELELDMLHPHRLSTGIQQRKLRDFLTSVDPALSLAILREFGAAKRSYHSPMKLFRASGRINNKQDVYDLTEHRFGDLVRRAVRTGIIMKINFGVVKKTDDLAKAILINNLAEDGQTFLLFKKALENVILDAGNNPHMFYTLDLGYLIADQFRIKLETSGLNKILMDDIIDEKNPTIVNAFLVKFRVLDLRYRS
jgi:hypothetical protein